MTNAGGPWKSHISNPQLERSSPEFNCHRSRLQTAQATKTGPLNILKDYFTASSNCEYSNLFDKPDTRTQLE
jgi:hypothetical protein